MEKINALIDKLQELKNTQANLQTISYYSQLLQAEILHQRNLLQRERDQHAGSHVAVILPAQAPVVTPVMAEEKPVTPVTEIPVAPVTTVIPEQRPAAVITEQKPAAVTTPVTTVITEQRPAVTPAAATVTPPAEHEAYLPTAPSPIADKPAFTGANENGYHPDRVPTRARQNEEAKKPTLFDAPVPEKAAKADRADNLRKDINELANKTGNGSTSLNDKLRQSNVEVAQKLGEMGVQDLKNAIGINDKFRFIEELFRGEKNMYERSIKTINECTSLQEASNWIERELKIKEGWLDDNPLVQHFYTLVKKRFS